MAYSLPAPGVKRRDLDDLAVDLGKILFLVAWLWAFGLWVDSGGSPRRMWESLQARAHTELPLTAHARGGK